MAKISNERIGEYLKAALQVLVDNGGQLPSREVTQELERRLDFDKYEAAILEKTGNIRWQSVLHFYSINLQKAGWLVKKKGVWYITQEGSEALKLTPLDLFDRAHDKYTEWRKHNQSVFEKTGIAVDKEQGLEESSEKLRFADYEQAQDTARKSISE